MITRSDLVLPYPQRSLFVFELDDVDEVRTASGTDALRLRGVATVYDHEYDVYGGPANMGWVERVARGACTETLSEKPDVVFLANHAGLPMARTKSETLQLTENRRGLAMVATLDRRDTDASNLMVKIERGDVTEMSFGFRVTGQEWSAHKQWKDDPQSLRTITAVNLNRGDVSAVTYGANPATSIDLTRSLEDINDDDLQRLQALIAERLGSTTPPAEPTGGMPVAETSGGMPAHLVAQLLGIHL